MTKEKTIDADSLTNSLMQNCARELHKQAGIDLYGVEYNAFRAILHAAVLNVVVKKSVPDRRTVKNRR